MPVISFLLNFLELDIPTYGFDIRHQQGLFCHRTRRYVVPANKKINVMKCLKFKCK